MDSPDDKLQLVEGRDVVVLGLDEDPEGTTESIDCSFSFKAGIFSFLRSSTEGGMFVVLVAISPGPRGHKSPYDTVAGSRSLHRGKKRKLRYCCG